MTTTTRSLIDMREVQAMRSAREFPPPLEEVSESRPAEFELNGTFLDKPEDRETAARRNMQTVPGSDPRPEKLELILNSSLTLLPFHFLRTGDQLGRAVVKLLRSDGAAGTGFLVAPGILLTNHHVLPDSKTAGSTIVLANYEAAHPGTTPGKPASVPLDPNSLFVTNSELDFTFCGVQGLDFLGAIPLDRNSLNIAASETVNIIQHPRGRPKEVALRDNQVVQSDSLVIQYACSTEPGSSGSPVFNNQWEPVALHHASVKSEGPEARTADDPSADASARYLNEGIRISAIALWLETEEANGPEICDQTARLRGIFRGIDPRVGFFGALGRKAYGRGGPELILESYRGESDDLDLAFWNVRGIDWTTRELLADAAQVVADMGMDLWWLEHADASGVASLRDYLESHYNLAYDVIYEPARCHPSLAILHRRDKGLAIERRNWPGDSAGGSELPPSFTVRGSTRRSGTVAFQFVAVSRPIAAETSSLVGVEAVRQAIRRGVGESDWIAFGETPVLFAPETLQVLADTDRELLAATDRDHALAILTGPRSKVAKVFVSPNLRPAFGVHEMLAVARDRELPSLLRALGGPPPIALRLTLDDDPRPSSPIASTNPRPIPPLTVDDLEDRLRDMLAPIVSRLLDEMKAK
jgi:V8-like Glu-specific endopeptidase